MWPGRPLLQRRKTAAYFFHRLRQAIELATAFGRSTRFRMRGGGGRLIHLLDLAGVSQTARRLAIELLENETGQVFGRDAFGWKQGWRENGAPWRRPRGAAL